MLPELGEPTEKWDSITAQESLGFVKIERRDFTKVLDSTSIPNDHEVLSKLVNLETSQNDCETQSQFRIGICPTWTKRLHSIVRLYNGSGKEGDFGRVQTELRDVTERL